MSDNQIDPLQDLLQESLAQAVEMFSLDELLDDSLKLAKEAALVKELRQRAASGHMSKEEVSEATLIIRSWESEREWVKTFNTVTFERAFCSCCGSYFPQFVAYGEEQEHKTIDVTRWVKVEEHVNPELPRKVLYQDVMVPICEECAGKEGWEIEGEVEELEILGEEELEEEGLEIVAEGVYVPTFPVEEAGAERGLAEEESFSVQTR